MINTKLVLLSAAAQKVQGFLSPFLFLSFFCLSEELP